MRVSGAGRLTKRAPRAAGDRGARSGYTFASMAVSSSDALEQLDALRERLKLATGRLDWLRSYL